MIQRFQGLNRLFVYEINFFDQSLKNDWKTYNNIRKIGTGQGYDYTTGCLLDYSYFKKILQINCCRFQQKLKIRCSYKRNTTNKF